MRLASPESLPREHTRWVLLLLIGTTLLSLGRVCMHDFTWWDDVRTVHHNPRMNPPTLQSVLWYWTHAEMEIYIPVTQTVWSVLASVANLGQEDEWGIALNPWVFHTANFGVHLLTSVVVFLLLRRLFEREWAAGAGAMLFALHPVQVESVAWVSGMKDLLCGCFTMTALLWYLRFLQESGDRRGGLGRGGSVSAVAKTAPAGAAANAPDGDRGHPLAAYALATSSFILATLSKPTGMVAPLLAGSIGLVLLRQPIRRLLGSLAPWLLVSIACAVVARLVQSGEGVEVPALWARPLIVGDTLTFYLWKLLWPAGLAVDYARRPLVALSSRWVYFTWLIPAGLAVGLWLARRRAPALLAAGLLFVFGMLPVLGSVPFVFQYYSTTADHYLYLPMLGVALVVTWALVRWPTPMLGAICAVWLAILGARSFVEAGYWKNDLTLWQRCVQVSPLSFAAHSSLGDALLRRGHVEEAGAHLRQAERIKPEFANAHGGMVQYHVLRGEKDLATDELRAYIRALELWPQRMRPDLVKPYVELGDLLMARDRRAEAAESYARAMQLAPNRADLAGKLANARAPASRPASQPVH